MDRTSEGYALQRGFATGALASDRPAIGYIARDWPEVVALALGFQLAVGERRGDSPWPRCESTSFWSRGFDRQDGAERECACQVTSWTTSYSRRGAKNASPDGRRCPVVASSERRAGPIPWPCLSDTECSLRTDVWAFANIEVRGCEEICCAPRVPWPVLAKVSPPPAPRHRRIGHERHEVTGQRQTQERRESEMDGAQHGEHGADHGGAGVDPVGPGDEGRRAMT